jgi:hypothetical protein
MWDVGQVIPIHIPISCFSLPWDLFGILRAYPLPPSTPPFLPFYFLTLSSSYFPLSFLFPSPLLFSAHHSSYLSFPYLLFHPLIILFYTFSNMSQKKSTRTHKQPSHLLDYHVSLPSLIDYQDEDEDNLLLVIILSPITISLLIFSPLILLLRS